MDYTGVKLFCATKAKEREAMGDFVTMWLRSNLQFEIVGKVVRQSSDAEFHCFTIILFYRDEAQRS
jgi:hypothetical protein